MARVPPTLVRLLALVGALTLVLGVLGLVWGYSATRRGFSARTPPSALEAQLARALRQLAVPARVRALPNPLLPTDAVLQQARAHWADHCAGCHANNGSGQTSLGQSLYPPAPDMRAAPTQSLSDGELYAVIQNGIRLTGMPAWGEAHDEANADSWGLVHFIRHLPSLTPTEEREMEALNPKSSHETHERQQEEEFLNEP